MTQLKIISICTFEVYKANQFELAKFASYIPKTRRNQYWSDLIHKPVTAIIQLQVCSKQN